MRYTLTKLAPIGSGALCLWLIAAYIFSWQDAIAIGASGSIDDLAEAIFALTGTADFWLWFYLAFTVANTMIPAIHNNVSPQQKSAAAFAIGALILVARWIGGELTSDIAQGIEGLVGNLTIVVLQIIFINVTVVLVLGVVEAAIERVTGKSATFADGKMITMSRREAQERKAAHRRERKSTRRAQGTRTTVAAIKSVYDLKLPIPGPPGREPVSRSAAAVVNLQAVESDSPPRGTTIAKPTSLPHQPAVELERSHDDRTAPVVISSESAAPQADATKQTERRKIAGPESGQFESTDGVNAPFSRPFVEAPVGLDDLDASDRGEESITEETFPRPFALRTRADNELEIGESSDALQRRDVNLIAEDKYRGPQRRKYGDKTARTLKPTKRPPRGAIKSSPPEDGDSSYESLDADDIDVDGF